MSFMRSAGRRPVLLDTNVLVTAVDVREQDKAEIAARVLSAIMTAGLAVVSPQVIAEYIDVTTRPSGRTPALFSRDEAVVAARAILASSRCVDLTALTILEAARAAARYQMRIYDAHIWAAAHANGIDTILTEDTPGRPSIEGVRYVNPFGPSFKLAQIGL